MATVGLMWHVVLKPVIRDIWNGLKWIFFRLEQIAVIGAVLFWFSEAPDRTRERHYRAWDVINSARGSTSDGGRIAALQDLNNDRVSLAAAPLKQAYLPGVNLERPNLEGADLEGADLTGANLQSANLKKAKLHDVNLFGANLQHAKLGGSISRELHKSNLSLKTEESGSGIGCRRGSGWNLRVA